MKKSKRFFSFVGIALCAVMLLGSVGSLSKLPVVEAQETTTLNKTYSLSTLSDMSISSTSTASYLEYGEYPQSLIGRHNDSSTGTTLYTALKSEIYGNQAIGTTDMNSITAVNKARKNSNNYYNEESKPDNHFSYDDTTGYFTVKKEIAGLSVGTRFYEYISGVNALSKYPQYQSESSGEEVFQDTRSRAVRTQLDTIDEGAYYLSSGHYVKCTCNHSDGTCWTGNTNYWNGSKYVAAPIKDWVGNTGIVSGTTNKYYFYGGTQITLDNDPNSEFAEGGRDYPCGALPKGTTETSWETETITTDIANLSNYSFSGHDAEKNAQLTRLKNDILANSNYSNLQKMNIKKITIQWRNRKVNIQDYYFFELYDIVTDVKMTLWSGQNDSNYCSKCRFEHNGGSSSNVASVEIEQTIIGQNISSSVTKDIYASNVVSYFLVEPIKWRITDNDGGVLTLQSDIILDSMNYNLFSASGTNFNTSYLRNWLNNGSSADVGNYNVLNNSGATSGTPISERNTNAYSYIGGEAYDEDGVGTSDYDRMIKEDYPANLAAYKTSSKSYSNSMPTFYNMAFANEELVKASDVLQAFSQTTNGKSNYNTNNDSSTGTILNNVVSIPQNNLYCFKDDDNTDKIVLRLGSKASKGNNGAYRPYSDFAEATGLVCHYNGNYNSYANDYTNGLIWTWEGEDSTQYGYNSGVLHQKLIATFDNDGKITAGSSGKTYNQINQNGGVVPVIKLDTNEITDVVGVKSSADTVSYDNDNAESGQTISTKIEQSQFTDGTTLTFVKDGGVNTTVDIMNYAISRPSTGDYTLQVNLTGYTGVKYLKFAFTDSDTFDSDDSYFMVPNAVIHNADADNGAKKLVFSISDNTIKGYIDSLNSEGTNLNIHIFAVTEQTIAEGRTLLTESKVNETKIKYDTFGWSTPSGGVSGNSEVTLQKSYKTLYEGESYTLPEDSSNEAYNGYFAGYDIKLHSVNAKDYEMFGTTVLSKGHTTIKYIYDRAEKNNIWLDDNSTQIVSKWQPVYNEDTGALENFEEKKEATPITHLYRDGIEQSFKVKFGPFGLENSSYVIDGNAATFGNTAKKVAYFQYTTTDGKITNSEFHGEDAVDLSVVGYYRESLSFKVYIKSGYIGSFNNAEDIMTKKTKPFFIVQFSDSDSTTVSTTDFNLSEAITDGSWESTDKTYQLVKTTDTLTYTKTTGTYTTTITVKGPENVMAAGENDANGIVSEKYYEFTISGIPTGKQKDGYALWVGTNGAISDGDVAENTYTFELKGTGSENRKTDLKYATLTEGVSSPTTVKDDDLAEDVVSSIKLNSSLTADVQFNKGYSLAVNSDNQTVLPNMTFNYATQVLDEKGYRLSKNVYYSTNNVSDLYTPYTPYQGKYVRLDANGNLMQFDGDGNLQYFYGSGADIGSGGTGDTTNINGSYAYKVGSAWNIMLPLLILDIKETGDQVSGNFYSKVVFVPYMTVTNDDGSKISGLPNDEVFSLDFTDTMIDGLEISYIPANFDTDDTYGHKKYITESLSLLSDTRLSGTTEQQNTSAVTHITSKFVALGYISNTVSLSTNTIKPYIKKYYEKMFNMTISPSTAGTVEAYINSCVNYFIDNLGNPQFNENRLAIDTLSLGDEDVWTYTRYTNTGTKDDYAKLLINKSRNKDEQKKTLVEGQTYSLDAFYYNYIFGSSTHKCTSVFAYMNEYGSTLTGLTSTTTEGTTAYLPACLTPVDKNVPNFPVWTAKVNSTIGGVGTENSATGYKAYTLTSGLTNNAWNNEARQYLYITAKGETKKMTLINDYPAVQIGNLWYGAKFDEDNTIERKLYLLTKNTQGNWVFSTTQLGGQYTVVFTRPITATAYVLEETNSVKPCIESAGVTIDSTNQYRKGDVIIRVTINNIASLITMTIDESQISNHKYPIEFYSYFGGNYDSLTPLFDGAYAEAGLSFEGLQELTSYFERMVTVDMSTEQMQFIPYVIDKNGYSQYYFMAPISMVASAGANKLGITLDNGSYYVNGSLLVNQEQGTTRYYKDSITSNEYYFTTQALEFKGWTLVTQDRITAGHTTVHNWPNVVFSQLSYYNTLAEDSIEENPATGTWNEILFSETDGTWKYNTVSSGDLARAILDFTDNSVIIVLEAVYDIVGLNVELFSWNMADGGEDGIYNVLEQNVTTTGIDAYIDTTTDGRYFLQNSIYSGNGYVADDIDYGSNISNEVYSKLVNALVTNLYYGKQATYYGNLLDGGNHTIWYEQLSDAKSVVEQQIFAGKDIDAEYVGTEAILEDLVNLGYFKVNIWDNQAFYTNDNRDFYIKINWINAGSEKFAVEAYKKFVLYSDEDSDGKNDGNVFKGNVKLYQVFETKLANITTSGFGDTEPVVSYTGPSSVRMGTDLVADEQNNTTQAATLVLNEQYSQYVDAANLNNFLNSFTVTTRTRYDDSITSFTLANYYGDNATEVIAVTVGADGNGYTVITLSIKGVVDNITITGSNNYELNGYTMTIANPSKDNAGNDVVDASGNALSYGKFYLTCSSNYALYDEDGNQVTDATKYELVFANATQETIVVKTTDGSVELGKVTITYPADSTGNITLSFAYGTSVMIMFERYEAFSQYIDTVENGGTNNRPFTIANSSNNINFTNVSEFSLSSGNTVEWKQDADNAAISTYRIAKAIDNYTLTWNNITLNTYTITDTSDKYSTTLFSEDDAEEILSDNVAINPSDGVEEGETAVYTLPSASYNQNVVLEYTINPAYTQFIPVLSIGTHKIPFAHMYAGMVDSSTGIAITANQANKKWIYHDGGSIFLQANSADGTGVGYYYTYSYNSVLYRIEGIAEGYLADGKADTTYTGKYKGYYVVTIIDADTKATLSTVGYIAYDEPNSKYYFILAGVKSNITAYLTSYISDTTTWSSKTNEYTVSYGTTDSKTVVNSTDNQTYYTFTTQTITNADVDADGFISNVSGFASTSSTTFSHGTMLRFNVVMNSDYTQSVPNFSIIVAGKTYQLADAVAEQGGTFEVVFTRGTDTIESKEIRTQQFSVGNLKFTVSQTITYDTTFNLYPELKTQLGFVECTDTEYKMYKAVTYTFDFIITDSFTIANGIYNASESSTDDDHIEVTTYPKNKYYVVFNGYDTVNAAMWPLTYKTGAYYYQEMGVDLGKKGTDFTSYQAINPFTNTLIGPDLTTEISKSTFATKKGYTYNGDSAVKTVLGGDWDFSNTVSSHMILRAEYAEETYKAKVGLTYAVGEGDDAKRITMTDYGTVKYQYNNSSSYTTINTNSDIVTSGTTVSYTKTNSLKVQFIMSSKYDNNSIRFSVDPYGEFKFPGDTDIVSNQYTSNGYSINISTNITDNSTGQITYTYTLATGKSIAQIVVTPSSNRYGASKNSTVYELVLGPECIDAGNTGDELKIDLRLVVADSTKADQGSYANIYAVTFYKATFNTYSNTTTVSSNQKVSYDPYSYSVYKEWENYTESESSDTYTVNIPHGSIVQMASSIPSDKSEKDSPTLDNKGRYIIYYIYQSVGGYTFNGWKDKDDTISITDSADSGAIYGDLNLFAVYQEDLYSEITYVDVEATIIENSSDNNINSIKGGYIFEEQKAYSNNGKAVKSSDEITCIFTLNPLFANTNTIKFSVSGASIYSVEYVNTGAVAQYIVKLKYFTATGNPTISIQSADLVKSAHTIWFKDYYYEPTTTMDYLKELTVKDHDVVRKANDGSSLSSATSVANIPHNTTLTKKHEWNNVQWDLDNRKNGGLVYKGWIYIKHSESLFDSEIKEIIWMTLNGYVPNGALVLEKYEVGFFYDNETAIVSNMTLLPYFIREKYDITFNQSVEGNVLGDDNERVMNSYANNITYSIPYGFPVINDNHSTNLENSKYSYVYSNYNTIKNIDIDARKINADNIYANHTFNKYYINGEIQEYGLEGVIVDGTFESIEIDFTRKTYTVTINSSTQGNAELVAEVQVKYGDSINLETPCTDANGETTIGAILRNTLFTNALGQQVVLVNESKGQYLAGWYYLGTISNGEEFTVTADSVLVPYVAAQEYSFAVSGVIVDSVGINGSIATAEDGFYKVRNNDTFSISFFPEAGWTSSPVITIYVNGEYIATGTTGDELSNCLGYSSSLSLVSQLDGNRIMVNLSGFAGCLEMTNGVEVEVVISQTRNIYTTEIFGDTITVEYESGNSSIFNFNDTNSSDNAEEILKHYISADGSKTPVSFRFNKTVEHGSDFEFVVLVDPTYDSIDTDIHFSITDGVNTQYYSFANGVRSEDNYFGTIYYTFYFNAEGNISIDINEGESVIATKQFTITYNYLFGGGVNGWESPIEGLFTYTFERSQDYIQFVPVDISGTKLNAPGTKDEYSQYLLYKDVWYVLNNQYTNTELINATNINEYCTEFGWTTYDITDSFNLYAFYIVNTHTVTPDTTTSEKGNLELPVIGGEYKADERTEANEAFADGYTFSYVLDAGYSDSQPVISVVGTNTYDFIIIDLSKLTETMTVKKSNSVIYTVTKTATGYTYAVQALGADGESYEVTVNNGVYTISSNGAELASASLDGLKTTITLNTVSEDFAIEVNDEIFEINKYSIKFIRVDGSVEEQSATYGSKLSNIPTESTSFIQKVVYIVTYADGTTEKLSGKELMNLTISEDLTIEIEVELNFVILIPLVVGAVVIIVVIVVVIVKASRNAGYKKSSGSANSTAFEKLNQNKPANNDASKKSDKPYNPYVDRNKDKK